MVGIGVFGRDVGDQSPNSQSYDYRHSARTWDVVTQVVCLTVTTICIGMRMYSKLLVLKNPGWEDYTCLLAWLGLIAYAVITIEADKHGNGVHQDMVDQSDLREYAKLANSSQIVYAPLIFVTKLSLFLLYLRVFAPSRRGNTYRIIYLFIWFNAAFYLANFFLKIFQCIPRSKIWDQDTPGHCININIPILVTAAINVLSDLMMLVLPIVCVWRLQMTTRRKLGISAIFAAGVFGCFSSIMRLAVSVKDRDTKDKTYDWFSEFLWTTAEVTCGIVASSLPALPTFFRHFFTKAKSKLSDLSHTKGSNTQSNSFGKPEESYALSRGRKNQLSHSLFTMERSTDPERESDDDRARIFCGSGYTTESRIERSRTPVQGGYYGEAGSGFGREDGRGILRIIEVDVESGPGQAISR